MNKGSNRIEVISAQVDLCRISVLLVTYNHGKYIRKALDHLFDQIIPGPIELVIADDMSSDRTLDIIREYEGRDSRYRFKYLNSTSNLGITRNYQRGFAACTGEYVAVLEGDDYWVNPMKLLRQRDFLDGHWECDVCSVNYFVYDEKCAHFTARVEIGKGHRFISARDLIGDNIVGNFSTCMYRKSALDGLPQALYEITSYEWIVNICIARHSLIGFIEEPMSVYRIHENGAWSKKSHVEKLTRQLELIPSYDELTDHLFKNEFERLAERLQVLIIRTYFQNANLGVTKPLMKFLLKISDFMPSGAWMLFRSIIPRKLKGFLVRAIYRNVV